MSMFSYAILESGSMFTKLNTWLGHLADGILDAALGESQLESVKRILDLNGSYTTILWSVVNTAINIIKPFGIGLIVTYFLIFMFDAGAKEQITVDSLVKVLIQLVFVTTLISNLEAILSAILSIGNSVYEAVAGVTATASDPEGRGVTGVVLTGKEIVNKWLETEKDTGATILIQSVLVWLIHQIAIIAIDFAAISRLIELGWKVSLAPIGVANCFEGGASSPAIKYLKGILGLALSSAAIYLTAVVGFALSGGLLSGIDLDGSDLNGALFLAQAALLATAGAAIGVSAKIKEVLS